MECEICCIEDKYVFIACDQCNKEICKECDSQVNKCPYCRYKRRRAPPPPRPRLRQWVPDQRPSDEFRAVCIGLINEEDWDALHSVISNHTGWYTGELASLISSSFPITI